jgi:hypothetical protein
LRMLEESLAQQQAQNPANAHALAMAWALR